MHIALTPCFTMDAPLVAQHSLRELVPYATLDACSVKLASVWGLGFSADRPDDLPCAASRGAGINNDKTVLILDEA